ncbi:hypothetical protein BC834DRAFT_974127 [Gloeopeniophorella convolvens]|nr:hypothetical protein BC834DRAFT_974127 [Gloeopeniophorella convolvens]
MKVQSLLMTLVFISAAQAACTNDPSGAEPCPPASHKIPTLAMLAIIFAILFIVIFSGVLIFLYLRQHSKRQKRSAHRERAETFRDMQRKGLQPWRQPDETKPGLYV